MHSTRPRHERRHTQGGANGCGGGEVRPCFVSLFFFLFPFSFFLFPFSFFLFPFSSILYSFLLFLIIYFVFLLLGQTRGLGLPAVFRSRVTRVRVWYLI